MRKRESDKSGWPALVRDVQALRERVERLERRRGGARAAHGGAGAGTAVGKDAVRARRLALLEAVSRAGGLVSREKFLEIGRSLGYHPRGLGGFFVGDATLERRGDVVRVTDRGFRLLEARFYEELQERPHRLPPMKPLFKIEGKSLAQTIIEMRNEEYEQ